ncbi:MAG TPA: FHA domain-containing protein [Actinomycetota bacterium]|nr:FHA domain-containing protein [Actinomycetota bacterium]
MAAASLTPLARDSTVSRLHAVVERIGAEWSIRDLGSQNGR